MNNYFNRISFLVFFIVLFLIVSIVYFKYLGITFDDSNNFILKKIVTVETFK